MPLNEAGREAGDAGGHLASRPAEGRAKQGRDRAGGIHARPADHPFQLDAIERSWTLLRRRATHNHLFAGPADLERSLRA